MIDRITVSKDVHLLILETCEYSGLPTGAPQCQVGQNWGAARPAGRDLAGIQARPGCVLQDWRPQVMCSLCGG